MSVALVSLLALLAVIVVSCFTPINIGVLSIALAFLIGHFLGGLPVRAIVGGFPASLCLTLIGITLLSTFVRDRPEPYGLRPDGDPPEIDAALTQTSGSPRRAADAGLTFHAVLRTKEFWLFTTYLSGTFAVNSAVQGHIIPYLQQDIGLTAASAALVMSMAYR